MSADERGRWIERLPKSAIEMTALATLKREYSLTEIATMTRTAPARCLDLPIVGTSDRAPLPTSPSTTIKRPHRHVPQRASGLKSGELVVRDGTVVNLRPGERSQCILRLPRKCARVSPANSSSALAGARKNRCARIRCRTTAGVGSVFEEVACRS